MSRRHLRRTRIGAPELPMFPFDLADVLGRVRAGFPELSSVKVTIWVQSQPTLACIGSEHSEAVIRLHAVLNHPDTPEEVIAFVLCHELLHRVIPPREIQGRVVVHPAEFWTAERERAPNRSLAWGWMYVVLRECLKKDEKRECTFVKANWKRLMNERRPSLAEVSELLQGDVRLAEEMREPLL